VKPNLEFLSNTTCEVLINVLLSAQHVKPKVALANTQSMNQILTDAVFTIDLLACHHNSAYKTDAEDYSYTADFVTRMLFLSRYSDDSNFHKPSITEGRLYV
jgi:hypothetical protein